MYNITCGIHQNAMWFRKDFPRHERRTIWKDLLRQWRRLSCCWHLPAHLRLHWAFATQHWMQHWTFPTETFSSLRRASILGLLTVRTVGQKAPTSKSAVPNPPSRQQSRRKRAISFPLTTKSAAKHAMTNSFSLSTATLLLQAPGLSSPAKLTGRM